MANVDITVHLPDGREAALIQEAAGYLGWEAGNGSAAQWMRKEVAGMLVNVIKSGRERARRETPYPEDEEIIT